MIASLTNFRPGSLYYNFGDAHVYLNHVEQCKKQIVRLFFPLPALKLNTKDSIDDFTFDDFTIEGYKSHPRIKAPLAI
jgi:thymidylate synthase